MTFVELLIAMTIMALVVGTLEMLAVAVHSAYGYNEAHSVATQHARVVLDRVCRIAGEAKANEQFPGFIVLSTTVGSTSCPDTLVVWHPSGAAADSAGLPRFNELVVYCPSPRQPNQLLEITVTGDARIVPSPSNASSWAAEIAAIKQSATNTQVVLTDLLQTCSTSASASSNVRGAVRFVTRLLPSDASYAQYKAGTATWQSLPWVQGNYGAQAGLRQAWLRAELQVMPEADVLGANPSELQALPYFASVAVYYMLGK
jgi:hypothetical protein